WRENARWDAFAYCFKLEDSASSHDNNNEPKRLKGTRRIRVDDLHMHFGSLKAVDGASIEIAKGSITGLIGPNGAGKTTLFNVIAGHYKPSSGQVWLGDENITGLSPHQLFHKGLLRTFQIAHEFSTLTVRENLMMVPDNQPGERLVDVWIRPSKVREREEEVRAKADEVIE